MNNDEGCAHWNKREKEHEECWRKLMTKLKKILNMVCKIKLKYTERNLNSKCRQFKQLKQVIIVYYNSLACCTLSMKTKLKWEYKIIIYTYIY